MYKRKSFYVRIPLPDGVDRKFFRVKVSVFDDILALNGHVHDAGLWPIDRFILAFNVGYPAGERRKEAWSHIMLAKGCADAGAIAHEGEHAIFFMMREVLGINKLDIRTRVRFGKRSAPATEEFICSSLQNLIMSVYESAEQKGIEL